ncbi:MAG TPA: glucose 1-dehydrogenase [Ktedonobacterales bacterium]|nr:glucose 1-dehydrogenase [Ktedonobacterales bacterium]
MDISEMFRLDGQVALVTGGGRGIGKTIAGAFGEAGAKLVITGRRAEWLTPTAEELRGQGVACLDVVADVTKPDDVERATQAALDAYGQVDILVNNAGQTWGQPAEEMPFDRWRQVIDVNLNGMFLMSQHVGRTMLARGSGRIINIASVAGLMAGDAEGAKTIAYNTSKAGVINFTRALAMEWGRRGIRVNAIAPGWFPTRMASAVIDAYRPRFEARTALGRLGDLDELKGVAIFLASSASSFITGQTIVVDGGMSL